jgi:hypothetical protein
MRSQRDDESFDPDAWEGDPEKLIGYDELLSCDHDTCDRTFSSKQDAFNTGFFLGEQPFLGSPLEAGPGSRPQFDRQARIEALAAIERNPWGDAAQAVEGVDQGLLLAMEATTTAFLLWQVDDAGEQRFGDEFELTPQQVDDLDPEWRLAYVARLIRTLALYWGVATEFSSSALGTPEEEASCPGSLMRKLTAITGSSVAGQS